MPLRNSEILCGCSLNQVIFSDKLKNASAIKANPIIASWIMLFCFIVLCFILICFRLFGCATVGIYKELQILETQPLDTRSKLNVHKITYVLYPEGKGTFGIHELSPNPMTRPRSPPGLGTCSCIYQVHISDPPVKFRICDL